MQFPFRAARATLVVVLPMLSTFATEDLWAQDSAETRPAVSDQSLDADQLAIYKEILSGWMDDQTNPINLSFETVLLSADDRDCGGKAVRFEPVSNQVHRFRAEDLVQIGGGNLRLVDPDKQRSEIGLNDPGKKIREGSSVDDAVRNGFKHGLVTLSEIRFNAAHDKAVVWYGFLCGGLCGNGGTVILEKKNGGWRRKESCSTWISVLARPMTELNLVALRAG